MTIRHFQKKIWAFYEKNRRDLPWRRTKNPYSILVSEIMLQQTQVSRVISKYQEFLRHFPSLRALARASEGDVLRIWQGLGYNRRGLMLLKIAREVTKIPEDPKELVKLPGIGPYTAAAISVFAFDQAVPMLETNIRRVFLHEFFPTPTDSPLNLRGSAEGVSDKEILQLVQKTLDHKRPREWYYALMDYGAMLAKTVPNPNRRSVHYTKQSPFEGSNRQKRGKLLKAWLEDVTLDQANFARKLRKLFPV